MVILLCQRAYYGLFTGDLLAYPFDRVEAMIHDSYCEIGAFCLKAGIHYFSLELTFWKLSFLKENHVQTLSKLSSLLELPPYDTV